MRDHLIRATAPGLRAFAAVTTNLVEEARQRHDCFPVATAALGRTMTGALLLAANLKTAESITVRISGDGPLKEVVADAYPDGSVRGYVRNPFVDLPLNQGKWAVGQAIGKGHIYVTRFVGLKQPFTGSAALVSGEIAEDITQYLTVSEQTPSSVALGVLIAPDATVAAAGGFFIQALPGAEDSAITQLENNLQQLPPVSQMVNMGKGANGILEMLFSGLPITAYDPLELRFNCQCSRERVENMLISLGAKEIKEMINDGQAEVCCHFCGEKYHFNAHELAVILKQIEAKK
ncbi:Hsp33 family molecular chaperone HslO [Sporomusa acidovorans]|uniref:33 kDa chaperonin n=1 Tax=Sporomusa acidovorans (strain ATCC 49682 / DSM 3132 / Mol) TaxID=1123286 RepID=A0ABZ3J388_SPOA4|nr:Hsp33 family molecular chaperone HslO [Sporomusa acidovorans]OZC20207.1 33 kDa chaperonin [Sporomusa acidovorans DSM 3132]SDD41903.1 molecular chaperone Hsp33 [Sporomusa acidovorans]